ncbi:DUF4190 domain-containing protein [Cryptosporangium minutisporangium]|uniref:DUF4190 domain-containing protein n=1 Tax=Cryptosporangium minutisporangium TaxID=113569 RepID=A0ABP6SZ66_9ACTN
MSESGYDVSGLRHGGGWRHGRPEGLGQIDLGGAKTTSDYQIPMDTRPRNGLATASLIVAIFLWPLGLILAVLALRQIKERGERGTGMAVMALILSLLSITLLVTMVVGYVHVAGK